MALRNLFVRPAMHRFALGGSWFFIIVSLLHLAWALTALLPDPGGTSAKLYHTVSGGVSYDAVGLTYSNTPGVALVLLQGLAVVGAAAATVLRHEKWRRIGHVTLIAWASLWALNLLWLTSIDHEIISYGQSLTMLTLLGCTIYRAMHGWNVPPRARPERAVEPRAADAAVCDALESITRDDISYSDSVRELQRTDTPEKQADPSRWKQALQLFSSAVGTVWDQSRALAVRLWPHVQRTVAVVIAWLNRMRVASVAFLRARGFVPHRSSTHSA